MPLVASQLFDQAEIMATSILTNGPESVSVWILEPMRKLVNRKALDTVKKLQKRCPHITIKLIGGINRLKDWPQLITVEVLRKRLGPEQVIFHCRGESALLKIFPLSQKFPQDRFHLDVRGHWPSEFLYRTGVELQSAMEFFDENEYINSANNFRLKEAIAKADSVSTVSLALKALLKQHYNAPERTYVVPCCIDKLSDRKRRTAIRNKWHVLENEKLIVYSGGTAAYQHLPDLVIPFLKELVRFEDIKAVFLSHQKEEIMQLLAAQDFPKDRVIVEQVPQELVRDYLSACDVGLMIRKPTLVNQLANPVKIAEYLGAGLPIILQKDVGGVQLDIEAHDAGIVIDLFNRSDYHKEIMKVYKWIKSSGERLKNALNLAEDIFLWENAILTHKNNYECLLGDTKKKMDKVKI